MPYKDKEKALAYREKHREEHSAYAKQHYVKNRNNYLARAQYWKEGNPEKVRAIKRKYAYNLKIEVLTTYGNGKLACVQCSESRLPCLSLDHINGGGHIHRKGGVGSHTYSTVKREGFPFGYQTLCMNCQWIKRHDNKEYRKYPHQADVSQPSGWMAGKSA